MRRSNPWPTFGNTLRRTRTKEEILLHHRYELQSLVWSIEGMFNTMEMDWDNPTLCEVRAYLYVSSGIAEGLLAATDAELVKIAEQRRRKERRFPA